MMPLNPLMFSPEKLAGIHGQRYCKYFPFHLMVDQVMGKTKQRENLTDDLPPASKPGSPSLLFCRRFTMKASELAKLRIETV